MFLTISDIREISAKMTEKIGVEYTGFGISFFRRRLALVMDRMHMHSIQDLYKALEDEDKVDEITFNMVVPATEMFRDPAFWRALRKRLTGKTSLSVWFPNLTNGYEIFSFVVLTRMMGIENVKIVGNVSSKRTLDEIKSLVISAKNDEVNRSNFERLESNCSYEDYFEIMEDGRTKPKSVLLDGVEFRKGWFITNSKDTYDLVIFRNALLDFGYSLHEKVVTYLADSLNPGGMLALGIKEPLIAAVDLKAVEPDESIYLK